MSCYPAAVQQTAATSVDFKNNCAVQRRQLDITKSRDNWTKNELYQKRVDLQHRKKVSFHFRDTPHESVSAKAQLYTTHVF